MAINAQNSLQNIITYLLTYIHTQPVAECVLGWLLSDPYTHLSEI